MLCSVNEGNECIVSLVFIWVWNVSHWACALYHRWSGLQSMLFNFTSYCICLYIVHV